VRGHPCELVSRNGQTFKGWPQLAEENRARRPRVRRMLDGEVCCLEPNGRAHFNKPLFRRERPDPYAFDVLSVDK
jgi:hypothetical protein